MKLLNLSILYVIFSSMLNSNDNYDDVKFFGWAGVVENNGKFDFRLPIDEIYIQSLLHKKVNTKYYKVLYMNHKPNKIIKYILPKKRVVETTFLDNEGIVIKTISSNVNKLDINLTCNYFYNKSVDTNESKNTKTCSNGLKEISYYNSLTALYKRINLKNDRLIETMIYKSPYCYYYDSNNSFIEKYACILEPDNIPIKLFDEK